MRYNDAYAKHVKIGCENKKLKLTCNILKKYLYTVKAKRWIFDAFY